MKKKKPEYLDEPDDAADNGAAAALLTSLGLTGYKGGKSYLQDKMVENEYTPTKSYKDFQGKLTPGDVLYYRIPTEYSTPAQFGDAKIPVKEAHALLLGKGDQFYHTGVYSGKGNAIQSLGPGEGVKNVKSHLAQHEIIAMRPKDKALAKKAVDLSKGLIGEPYPSEAGYISHALEHLISPVDLSESGGYKPKCGNGIACTEAVAEAYPDLLKNPTMSPRDMRFSKDFEFAARYAPKTHGMTALDKSLVYGGYPLLKSLSKAALVGGGVYGASKLYDMLKNKKTVKKKMEDDNG